MSKRMAMIVLFVIAFVIALTVYQRYRTYNHYSGGEVTAVKTSAAAVVEPAPAHVSTKSPAGQPFNDASADEPSPAATTSSADSQPANPPDRVTFRGTGRFQVYRQGDLTWRLDTDSGDACVLFATDEEWRNPRVYNRACGND